MYAEHCVGEVGTRQKHHLRCAALLMLSRVWWLCASTGSSSYVRRIYPIPAFSLSHTRALVACVYSQSLGIATVIQLSIKTKQSAVFCHLPSCGKLVVLIGGERLSGLKSLTLCKWFS